MRYINLSATVKTFYGVEFKPGDVKDVDGYINDPDMFIAFGVPVTKEPTSDTVTASEIPVLPDAAVETPAPRSRRKSNKEGE